MHKKEGSTEGGRPKTLIRIQRRTRNLLMEPRVPRKRRLSVHTIWEAFIQRANAWRIPSNSCQHSLKRKILLCSRSVDSWSIVFFMQWLSGWNPLIQYGHLVFSNFFFVLGSEGSFGIFLILFWIQIIGFGLLPLVLPFVLCIVWVSHQKKLILRILKHSHLNQLILLLY